MRLPYIYALVLSAITLSCSDTCTENKNTLPLAGFYESGGDSSNQISISDLQIRGLHAPGDSILSRANERKSEVYLPFRIDSDTTVYVFDLLSESESDILSDTVRFIYSRTPRFVNVECGVSYLFDMQKIEHTGFMIDSVTCPNGFIDNTNSENLKIYFRPMSLQ